MTGHFSPEALEAVASFFAEGQVNPLEGQCGQRKLREQNKTERTAAQQAADRARSQARKGKDTMNSSTRSAAAQKAAETRRRCKGGGGSPTTTA